MNHFQQFADLVKAGTSAGHFYRNMNHTLKRLNGQYTMLHYPMEGKEGQSFIEGQATLTNFSISLLGDIRGKQLLEIGCGNGVQAKYICQTYEPAFVTGIDLDPHNIEIARQQQEERKIGNMLFLVDDAQELRNIESDSMDVVISIESAFHYPDKEAFLRQVSRVLRPGGKFLVADLLTRKKSKGIGVRRLWKGKMELHHWDRKHYLEQWEKGDLRLHESVDITQRVVRGFRGYRRWISGIGDEGSVRRFLFRVFYIINVEWVLFLFRYRRLYLVYVGDKPQA